MRNLFSTTKHFIKVLCCLFTFSNTIYCQTNLVPNPSFEMYINCPQNIGSSRNDNPSYWYKPDKGGTAYFNRCTNNQPMAGVPYNFWGGD